MRKKPITWIDPWGLRQTPRQPSLDFKKGRWSVGLSRDQTRPASRRKTDQPIGLQIKPAQTGACPFDRLDCRLKLRRWLVADKVQRQVHLLLRHKAVGGNLQARKRIEKRAGNVRRRIDRDEETEVGQGARHRGAVDDIPTVIGRHNSALGKLWVAGTPSQPPGRRRRFTAEGRGEKKGVRGSGFGKAASLHCRTPNPEPPCLLVRPKAATERSKR